MARIPLRYIIGGAGVYLAATSVGYFYFQAKNAGKVQYPPATLDSRARKRTYDELAKSYDEKIGWDEFFMGLNWLRWRYMRQCKGRVLEVGCGTGRNLPYYPKDAHVTAVDASAEMIKEARAKQQKHKLEHVELAVMDAHRLRFPDDSFDCVVDTFGLCSYEDPQRVLKEMQRVCKPDGKIILLEHGTSKYQLLNNLLNKHAQQHADQWGCIWNKDMQQLVESAGIRDATTKRYHFGTTYAITAQNRKA